MLRFEALRAGYDGQERLHGVTCRAAEGRLTALIGPNGCGKSTLMKCAAGILSPYGGDILVAGQSLRQLSRKETARRVSYMPQSRLAPSIPAWQLVSHGRYPHLKWGHSLSPEDRKIVNAAMERTDTLRFAQRSLTQLSGGERQRVYLAMMLAQQTPLMLLDEPTAYLDLGGQFELMALLRALCAEGRTVVLVLHDLALALESADHILLMREGKLVSHGSPEEIYRSGALDSVFGIRTERTESGRFLFSSREKTSLGGSIS